MPELKAVIFDMDGLMIESEHLQSRSFEKILKSHGIEPIYNSVGVIQTVGITAKDNLKIIKEKHGDKIPLSVNELLELKNQIYNEIIDEGMEPMPGLHDLLESLKSSGTKLAVASSSIPEDIDKVLSMIEVKHYFDAIVSGATLPHSKPEPDIFLEAARQLDVEPAQCIVLEDAESGVTAGHRASMFVIAVPSQFTLDHNFSLANAKIKSLEELSSEKLVKMLQFNQ